MCQMSTEQSTTSKEGRRTTSIGNSKRTMAGYQYRYDRATTKVKRNRRHSGNRGSIHKILSNRGPQFALKFMEDLTKVLGTKRKLSMAYHPQTDGQTERINQEIGTFLRHYVNYKQDNWTEWLAMAEFAYNDKKHAATGRTPFELNFGRHPWKGDLMVQMELPRVEEFVKKLQENWKHVVQAMKETQKNMKQQFNKKRRNPQGLKVGEHVWLENKNIQSN